MISNAPPFVLRLSKDERRVFQRNHIPQLAVVNVIVTHENISEQAVYEMAKTIAENLDTLPERNPLFKGLRDLFEPLRSLGLGAFEFGGVPLHWAQLAPIEKPAG